MSEEIREKAEAFIEQVESNTETNGIFISIANLDTYKELKASLRPSREEIADQLQHNLDNYAGVSEELDREYINYAIEELRK